MSTMYFIIVVYLSLPTAIIKFSKLSKASEYLLLTFVCYLYCLVNQSSLISNSSATALTVSFKPALKSSTSESTVAPSSIIFKFACSSNRMFLRDYSHTDILPCFRTLTQHWSSSVPSLFMPCHHFLPHRLLLLPCISNFCFGA